MYLVLKVTDRHDPAELVIAFCFALARKKRGRVYSAASVQEMRMVCIRAFMLIRKRAKRLAFPRYNTHQVGTLPLPLPAIRLHAGNQES
jgi:hypothetical protein